MLHSFERCHEPLEVVNDKMQLLETFLVEMSLVERVMILTVIAAAIVSLVYAWWLRKGVLAQDKGTEQMQKVWNGIREGALSYLNRQLNTIKWIPQKF